MEELKRNPRSLPALKHVGYGASPITRTLLEEGLDLLGCDFSQVYGMTEAGGGLCFLPPEDHRTTGSNAHRLTSAGRPGNGVDVEVRNATGERLPTGRSGELWFRATSLTRGYLGDEEASRALIVDAWLNSRDVGRVDEDGYVYVEGRADDMIVTGGENVHPRAVEDVLASMPGVQDCAVYGVPDDHWGQAVAAALVADPATVTEADVVAYCKERLAGYQVPRRVLFVPDLPRTAAGKVVRKQLSDMTLAASETG
ncbi:fatty acid--CoA ligase family protein [Actinomadura sp. KC06]|uniref:class I adenylate-forming enzyme family protein n=1 Tax=Actinomadura sp. KC06 TaxID=2530369 RepID=UPI00140555EE|nr:fatty acid--CoA ligase family protein [Actinomadura sp. KC06]